MFDSGKHFQLSLIGKARRLQKSGAPKRGFSKVGSGLTCKHYSRMERLAREKNYNLLRTFVNYGRKMSVIYEFFLLPTVFVRLGCKKLGRYKRSSLLQKLLIYGRKQFYNIWPWCHSLRQNDLSNWNI